MAVLFDVVVIIVLMIAYYLFGAGILQLIVLLVLDKTKLTYLSWGKVLKVKLNLAAIVTLHLSLS